GTDVLIEMMEELGKTRDDIYFLLAGPHVKGTEDTPTELSTRIEKAGQSENFRLLGQVQDIASVFKVSDFFVLPSRAEGFGIVLVESLASGCITIVSNLEGIFDSIITHEQDGFIIKNYDGKEYAKTILKLIDLPDKLDQVRKAGFDRVNKKYSKENLISGFKTLLGKPKRS
ncbi:MAG: glycosyltransferase family 4 protein, partial [Deltaproteobacteria bacterium]|nr:glycosyltransferase family 4 protein [Deltaproteobacteria bacterium]